MNHSDAFKNNNSRIAGRFYAYCFALIIIVGATIRLTFLLLAGSLDLHADESTYVYLALQWNRFGFFGHTAFFVWPPGYPAFLALFFRFFAESGIFAAKFCQVLITGLIGSFLILTGRELFNRKIALVAGGIWAVYLPLIAYSHYLWSETLFLGLLMPHIYFFIRLMKKNGDIPARHLMGFGVISGLELFLKTTVLPLIIVFCIMLLFRRSHGKLKERTVNVLIIVLTIMATVTPYIIRNAEVFGRFVPVSSIMGYNLWLGVNARYHNMDLPGADYEEVYDEDDWTYRCLMKAPKRAFWRRSNSVNLIDKTREEVKSAWKFVRSYPGFFVRSRIKKLADWFTPLTFFIRHHYLEHYQKPLNQLWVRRILIVACLLQTIFVLGCWAPGLLSSALGRTDRLIVVAVILCFLVSMPVVSMSRFRLPVEPVFIILTAAFVCGRGRRRQKRRLRLFSTAGYWIILAALWIINWKEVRYVLEKAL